MWYVFGYGPFVKALIFNNCDLKSLHTYLGHWMIELEWLHVLRVVHIRCVLNIDIYFQMK